MAGLPATDGDDRPALARAVKPERRPCDVLVTTGFAALRSGRAGYDPGMRTTTILLGAALGGIFSLEVRKRLRQRNANWLRNDQGVGPAHQPGTHRGEERVIREGPEGGATVADRINEGGAASPS